MAPLAFRLRFKATKSHFILEPLDLTTDKDIGWMAPALSSLFPASGSRGETTLTLLDMRKLRFRKFSMAPEWEQMIYSYDLLIVVPHLSPATWLQ